MVVNKMLSQIGVNLVPFKEGLKFQWANWLLGISQDISKPLRIIVSEFVISIIFIILDVVIVLIIGWAVADIISQYIFVAWLFDGIKFGSFIVIALRYLSNCFFQILEETKKFKAKLKMKEEEQVR